MKGNIFVIIVIMGLVVLAGVVDKSMPSVENEGEVGIVEKVQNAQIGGVVGRVLNGIEKFKEEVVTEESQEMPAAKPEETKVEPIQKHENTEENIDVLTEEDRKVNLYFPNKETLKLEKEVREFTGNEEEVERFIFEELKKGSQVENRITIVNSRSQILGLRHTGKTLIINMNEEFLKKSTGSLAEVLLVYSIVNSYTDLEKYDKVKFLINDEEIIAGTHEDLTIPLSHT